MKFRSPEFDDVRNNTYSQVNQEEIDALNNNNKENTHKLDMIIPLEENCWNKVIKPLISLYSLRLKHFLRTFGPTFIPVFLTIFGLISYKISLEGCFMEPVKCFEFYSTEKVCTIGAFVAFSCLCFFTVNCLIYYKYTPKTHLLYIIPCYLIVILSDIEADLDYHGQFNMTSFIVFYLMFFVLFNLASCVLSLIRKRKFKLLFIILLLIFVPSLSFFFNSVLHS